MSKAKELQKQMTVKFLTAIAILTFLFLSIFIVCTDVLVKLTALGMAWILLLSAATDLDAAEELKASCETKEPEPFKLTAREMEGIIDECDDTAGMLVKESTLRFFSERAVNEDRKERAETA